MNDSPSRPARRETRMYPSRRLRLPCHGPPSRKRQTIADWAKLHDVEIVQWWEELDQSGAKLERPMF